MRPVIERLGEDEFAVHLDPPEREMIEGLAAQLEELLETDSPLLVRLFPPPYGDDLERNEGYAALAVPELIEHRRAAIEVLRSSADATRLNEEELTAWMRSINDLRLVLGTMLGIETDDDPVGAPEGLEHVRSIYGFMGALLETIVNALED
jgi:hypothetical protein